MYNIFKFLLKQTLFSHLSGKMFHFLLGKRVRVRLKSGVKKEIFVDTNYTSYPTLARLHLNTYERHERKIIDRYFKGSDLIIELGASLGVVSSELLSKFPQSRLICVEGNANLISNLKKTLSEFSESRVSILSCIIGESSKTGFFDHKSDSLSASLNGTMMNRKEASLVQTVTLSKLLEAEGLDAGFSLVADIEGAEYYLFEEKEQLFTRCHEIAIELHEIDVEGRKVTINDHIRRIKANGFALVGRSERAFYFSRSIQREW